jgi:hypothetical protein
LNEEVLEKILPSIFLSLLILGIKNIFFGSLFNSDESKGSVKRATSTERLRAKKKMREQMQKEKSK